jgi:carboxyl-terminal processing protease
MTHGNGVRIEASRALAGVSVMLALAACGGGGNGPLGDTPAPAPPSAVFGNNNSAYQAGIFMPSASFKDQCASPRNGKSAITGITFPDKPGSVLAENNFLRSWTNELYLWYSEVPDQNPASFSTKDYFPLLKTAAKTLSGADKDKFHFTETTEEWESFSQAGTSAGYGATFFILKATPPREVVVAFTDPNTPASQAGLQRGDEIRTIDGIDVVNANTQTAIDALNSALSPSAAGQSHSFQLLSNAGIASTVTMVSATVTSTPVQNVQVIPTAAGNLGYLLFNAHIATAESQLITAIETLKSQNVVDLVVDMRYNGGGFLDVASELAYMIAGDSRTQGATFETTMFNDKHTSTDPVTNQPLAPTPFNSISQGFSVVAGVKLPTLDLSRVFILTSSDTCSASEAVINGLRGVDIQVIQIGTTTCGKPYGFYPQDNCGTTYFSIQFKGVNAKGFGDYSDGFSPQNTLTAKGEPVAGCSVADDFTHALGDPNEALLSSAMSYAMSGNCSTPPAQFSGSGLSKPGPATQQGWLVRPESQKNRIMRRLAE